VEERIHTMNDSNYNFRLVVIRELREEPDLFGIYRYYAIITNIPGDSFDMTTAEEIVWHHNGRGDCEHVILKIRSMDLPCDMYHVIK
jgi:hypothetical protein